AVEEVKAEEAVAEEVEAVATEETVVAEEPAAEDAETSAPEETENSTTGEEEKKED
ncbi:hypothetical protein G5B35_26485, partial [Parapusillimonas sp. SGNA-6]|nr:hypothetical protein [Parapusillimonas sp. SGNA-6]